MPVRLLFGTFLLVFSLSAGASAQISNPSFELSFGAPLGWTEVVPLSAVQFLPDIGMPTDGSRYVRMFTNGVGPATPHSNPGGPGVDATGTTVFEQTFTVADANETLLKFDAALLGDDTEPDFFEASVSDGSSVWNIARIDASAFGTGPASALFPPFQTTTVQTFSVDLATLFPLANANTQFTLRFHLGNATDNLQDSRAYVDNIRLDPGIGFSGSDVSFTLTPDGVFMLLDITTAVPFSEYYHLISQDVSLPVGLGPFAGLVPDAQTFSIVATPVGLAGLHDLSDANGKFVAPVPVAWSPVGTVFDHTLAVLAPGATLESIELTPVYRRVWGQ